MDSPERRIPMIRQPRRISWSATPRNLHARRRPSTKKSRNVLRARETGSGVAKPVLKLSRPRDDGECEDQSQPEFVPEHGHRVSGMPIMTHMCGLSFRRYRMSHMHRVFSVLVL